MKTLCELKVRLNVDVLHNEQVTELNLFNRATAVKFQNNQLTSINSYGRTMKFVNPDVDDTGSIVSK